MIAFERYIGGKPIVRTVVDEAKTRASRCKKGP